MERVELLTVLEQRRGTRVADAAGATIFTVRQLVEAVEPVTATPGETRPLTRTLSCRGTRCCPHRSIEIVRDLQRPKWFFTSRITSCCAWWRWCKVTPGFRVDGRKHIPATGPCVISPNHQSYLDPFFLSAALLFATCAPVVLCGRDRIL